MTTPSPISPPMNHVFVDFENVHQVDLSLIGAKSVSFTLMVGAKQTKLDSDLVEKLMAHSSSVQLVKLKSSGKNALDFALAYYLGRAALADPTAYFHIVSKDGGFDPLIEHLRARHIHVYRHVSCAELTFTWPGKKIPVSEPIVVKTVAKKAVKKVAAKKAAKKVAKKASKKAAKQVSKAVVDAAAVPSRKVLTIDQAYERVYDNFLKPTKTLPARYKALWSEIKQLTGFETDSPEAADVIKRLKDAGLLDMSGDRPVFSL